MTKQYTSHEIERLVLDYINEKVVNGYTIDFNPLHLSLECISLELNLRIEEVDEAIRTLSGQNTRTSRIKKIESVKPKFSIWLPNTKEGDEIKKALCESGLAIKGSLNVFYSFIIILLSYIFIFKIPDFKQFSKTEEISQLFWWVVIITVISIPLGNYLSRRWYQLTLLIQKVKGYKYYIYSMIAIIFLIFISINQGWKDLWLVISGIAALCNIFLFVIQLIKKAT